MSQCDMLREHESCMSLLLNFMVNYKIEAEGDEAAQVIKDLVCHAQVLGYHPLDCEK